MMNQSSIFFKREDKMRVLGGIRFVSTSLSSKRQKFQNEQDFYLTNIRFKGKRRAKVRDLGFKIGRNERTTEHTSPPSPQLKNSCKTRFTLCTSKNVCVFTNLRKVQKQVSPQLSLPQKNKKSVLNQIEYTNTIRISKQNQNFIPLIQRESLRDQCQQSVNKFKMRKISSSQNCKSERLNNDKIFGRWDNEDLHQDHDIIFYK